MKMPKEKEADREDNENKYKLKLLKIHDENDVILGLKKINEPSCTSIYK